MKCPLIDTSLNKRIYIHTHNIWEMKRKKCFVCTVHWHVWSIKRKPVIVTVEFSTHTDSHMHECRHSHTALSSSPRCPLYKTSLISASEAQTYPTSQAISRSLILLMAAWMRIDGACSSFCRAGIRARLIEIFSSEAIKPHQNATRLWRLAAAAWVLWTPGHCVPLSH